MRPRLVVLCVLLFTPLAALAQPLASRVPADAIVYIGWCGTESMPPGYDQSRLRALVQETNIAQMFYQVIPQAIKIVEQHDKNGAEDLRKVVGLLSPVLRHPTAVYFAGVEIQGMPRPKMAILCQAGPDADATLRLFQLLIADAQDAPFPVKAFKQDDLVGITVGYDTEAMAIAGAAVGPKPITTNAAFTAALSHVQKDAAAILFVDTEKAEAQFAQLLQFAPPEAQTAWTRARDALGLNNLKCLAFTSGFDGRDWSTRGFIAAPAPRTGLLTMLDAPPVSEDLLRAIPKGATSFAAGRFDLAKLLTEVRTAAGKIDPQAQQGIDMGLGAAKAAMVLDIQKGLLEPLGDEWAFYTNPDAAGSGLLGITFVNRLRNPAEAQRGLTRLELFLDNTINGQLQQQREKLHVGFEQVKVNNVAIHYVAVPGVSPAWAIKDGVLYAGLYPQVVAAAVDADAVKNGSLLDNPDFQAMHRRLAVPNASGLSYADLPRTAGDMYQFFLLGTQFVAGFGDLIGAKTPPMILPPLSRLRQHLAPAGSASWTDDAGWHMKSISPFPGSEMIGSQNGLAIGAASMGLGIALPAAARARESARRVQSMSNLKQIGVGCMLYANDHRGKYPADLGLLHTEDGLNLEVFLKSDTKVTVPPGLMARPPQERAAWVNANSDYVYLGATVKPSDPPDTILVYEKATGSSRGGINILFNDGHVAWTPMHDAVNAITKQTGAPPAPWRAAQPN